MPFLFLEMAVICAHGYGQGLVGRVRFLMGARQAEAALSMPHISSLRRIKEA
jgi:hypothetical protein